MDKKALGARIKEARARAGVSQQELADRLECSAANVSQWETGKRLPKLGTLVKIAAALGVKISDVFPEISSPALTVGVDVGSMTEPREVMDEFMDGLVRMVKDQLDGKVDLIPDDLKEKYGDLSAMADAFAPLFNSPETRIQIDRFIRFMDFLKTYDVILSETGATFDGTSFDLTENQLQNLPNTTVELVKALVRSMANNTEKD